MQLSQTPRIHPLIAAAAASIILVCLLGMAVLVNALPLGKDGSSSFSLILSGNPAPAATVVQPPSAPALPMVFGPVGPVAATTAPVPATSAAPEPLASTPLSTTPVDAMAPVTPTEAVTSVTSVPSTAPVAPAALPAFDAPEALPAKQLPRQPISPVAASTPAPARRPAPEKIKGLSPAQLDAARRATDALANGRSPEADVYDDAPVTLRPVQREEARRATALLAEAAQAGQSSDDRGMQGAVTPRMSAEQLQAARELEAARARANGRQGEPAADVSSPSRQ